MFIKWKVFVILNRKIKRNIIASIHPNMEIRCYEVACINELGEKSSQNYGRLYTDRKFDGKFKLLTLRKICTSGLSFYSCRKYFLIFTTRIFNRKFQITGKIWTDWKLHFCVYRFEKSKFKFSKHRKIWTSRKLLFFIQLGLKNLYYKLSKHRKFWTNRKLLFPITSNKIRRKKGQFLRLNWTLKKYSSPNKGFVQ